MKRATIFYALAIGTKLLPIAIFPIIIFQLNNRQRIKFVIFLSFLLAIIFIPYLSSSDLTYNLLNSLQLYYNSFEFNSSIYKIASCIVSKQFLPILAKGFSIAALLIMIINYFKPKISTVHIYITAIFVFWLVYFLTASTVHPWYLGIFVIFAIFSNQLWLIVWGMLSVFTYITYSVYPYQQHFIINLIEYSTIAIIAYLEYKYPAAKAQIVSRFTVLEKD